MSRKGKVIISLDNSMYHIWNLEIIQHNAWDILNKIG